MHCIKHIFPFSVKPFQESGKPVDNPGYPGSGQYVFEVLKII